MRDARKQMGSVGPSSGVEARSGLALAPGKRTLTEGLQPSRRTGGGENDAADPDGALLGSTWRPTAPRASARSGDSNRTEGFAVDLAVRNDAGMFADAPQGSLAEDTLRADGPWHAKASSGESGVLSPAVGDVDTQCVSEAFARDLSDEALEQTIEYLIQRRDRPDLAPIDCEVVLENLGVLAAESARRGQSSGALGRDAVRTLIREATAGAQEIAGILQQLAGNRNGLRNHPATEQFLQQAVDRLTWVVDTASAGISYMELATNAGGQAGPALHGMAATRAQAALVGLAILRPWCAFLQLHDRVAMLPLLQLEYRYRVLDREQRSVQAVFAQLAGFDPDEIAIAGAAVSGRVAALATAFDEVIAEIERAEEVQRRAMQIQLAAEVLTFAVGLRGMFSMRAPPSAMAFPMPAIAGAGGSAATMGQIVISAEWVAAIRHLIEIGAISAAGAAEMLRVRGFTSAMAQATDLPQSVKDLLGEGPTTDAMKVTNTTGAGAARAPRHHVLPKEHRQFFEERGFTGDLDIDNFTVELETADHQAQHGGGNWKLGRQKWPGEWNRMVMERLREAEKTLGRRLTLAEIMEEIEWLMKAREIPVRFVPYRGD
jgi:hypothetical protein